MKVDQSKKINRYQNWIESGLAKCAKRVKTKDLRDPIDYVLRGRGKRIRPLLTLLACEITGGNPKSAIPAAIAIELLHNFTLVHDDIMDRDASRRGRPTVHTKWDEGTAILTGDGILGLAYQILMQSPPDTISRCTALFSRTIVDVCEGQALDKEFEKAKKVTRPEYQRMIYLKTARLIQTSAEIGAIIGGATPRQAERLSKFARNIGMAFQIQDDLLDVVAKESILGKDIGSDIASGKKTFLIIDCLDRCSPAEREFLINFRSVHPVSARNLKKIMKIFLNCGTIEFSKKVIDRYYRRALKYLRSYSGESSFESLRYLIGKMMSREF